MAIRGMLAGAVKASACRMKMLMRSPNASLALACVVLGTICAAGVALRAEGGAAYAAEYAAAQSTDLNTGSEQPAGAPTDTPGEGGGVTPSDLNVGPPHTLSTNIKGAGTGTVSANPDTGPTYSSSATVVLTAQPSATSEFGGWTGDCTGVALTCTLTMTADRTVTATFNIKTVKLTVTATGGTVSAPPSNRNSTAQSCQGGPCIWTYPYGESSRANFTATPAPGYIFKEWGGLCAGTGVMPTCSAVFSSDASVVATFVPLLRVGAVFSTAQPASRSFIRFFNTGSMSGSAAVTLYNAATGKALGVWTTPVIPAGTAPQFFIGDIELALGLGPANAKPDYYGLSVETTMNGYFQHVLWRASDGTLTNLSTCGTGVTMDGRTVANVHASIFDANYPSSIVVTNTGTTATTTALGVYDAATGARLGSYTAVSIPAQGRVVVPMQAMEGAIGITPSSTTPHYIVKIDTPQFTGFLQHLVNNKAASVVTDMTTACALDGAPGRLYAPLTTPSLIFSTAQPESQSFIRLSNAGTAAGTAIVRLYDYLSGQQLGSWTSPSIPAGAEQQFFIGDIEKTLPDGTAKPDYYGVTLESNIWGGFQHVLWRSAKATLTNLSSCPSSVAALPGMLTGVHSSLLNASYPSSIVINNTGTTALDGPLLGIYDARDGTKLGVYAASAIAPNTQVMVSVSAMEAQAKITPADGMYHYVIKAEAPFSGFVQHLVNNTTAGVITDLSTFCVLRGSGAPPF